MVEFPLTKTGFVEGFMSNSLITACMAELVTCSNENVEMDVYQ